jgi:ATP-dependent Lon protease
VIIPKDNEKDLADVPANVLKNLKVILVEHVDEVLKFALLPEEETKGQANFGPYRVNERDSNNPINP